MSAFLVADIEWQARVAHAANVGASRRAAKMLSAPDDGRHFPMAPAAECDQVAIDLEPEILVAAMMNLQRRLARSAESAFSAGHLEFANARRILPPAVASDVTLIIQVLTSILECHLK